jgi:predicted RNase H-like nuclease
VTDAAYLGVDLAWGLGSAARPANETGLVALDASGAVLDAGWTRGVDATAAWVLDRLGPRTLVAVDASLVVTNPVRSMRAAERQVGQRYGRWRVTANPTHPGTPHQAGARLLDALTEHGVAYLGGTSAMRQRTGPGVFECYPYTTLVGVEELGYDDERPRYKRLDAALDRTDARARRAVAFDDLVRRLGTLDDPPLRLDTNPVTAALVLEPAGLVDRAYKHREDLLDGALCAWTAAFWERHGDDRVQVLGADPALSRDPTDALGRRGVVVAPARPSQRR